MKMNKAIKLFLTFLCCMLLATQFAYAQNGASEYQVKAAFLFNFAKFVEWPSDTGALHVCIIGDDPFGQDIADIKGKIVGGKKLFIRLIQSGQNIKNCQILFIASSESDQMDSIIAAAQRSNILTVGDKPHYAERGVIINFYEEQNKVRFEINRDAADRSGLKISSKLFGLARIVQDARRKGH